MYPDDKAPPFFGRKMKWPAAQSHSRCLAWIAGAGLAGFAAPAGSQDIPWAEIDHVSLNPTSFYVSVQVANAWAPRYFALEAYEGEPVGSAGGVQRAIVSDWVQGADATLLLHDTSAPLSPSGRTYNVAIAMDLGDFYVLGPNEVHAPYPFFMSPVISSIVSVPTNAGSLLAVTYGEGLYTNTVYVPSDGPAQFIRVRGTNHVPTNAAIERSAGPDAWTSE